MRRSRTRIQGRVQAVLAAAMEWFFECRTHRSGSKAWSAASLILLCFLIGCIHWVFFFWAGQVGYTAHDWPKEISYLRVVQEALREGRVPWYVSEGFQGTSNFFGLPETNLSPQGILLRWMQPGTFAWVNILVLYTVGFAGCLTWMRRGNLSLFGFVCLFLLFNFNGYLTSRMAVGHSMWSGCFFLPWFALGVARLVEVERKFAEGAKIALIMSGMLLQGAFHLWIWCLLFLAVLGLANQSLLKSLVGAGVLAVGIALFRLVPAAVSLTARPSRFLSGYPTLLEMVRGFIELRTHLHPHMGASFGEVGWWEYDIYIGLAGFLFLLWFGVARGVADSRTLPFFKVIRIPVAILVFLSLADVWALVAFLPLPFASVERVSARFIIVPFVFLLLAASRNVSVFMEKRGGWWRAGAFAFLALVAQEVMQHTVKWRIPEIENDLRAGLIKPDFPSAEIIKDHIVNGSDLTYEKVLFVSLAISIVVAVTSVFLWLGREKRRAALTCSSHRSESSI